MPKGHGPASQQSGMSYFATAQTHFRAAPALSQFGYAPEGVEVWGKGADHNDLLQIKKPSWRVLATDGRTIGYQGVEVHWESCRPGHWVLHCELWPRQGKAQKSAALSPRYAELLDLKAGITQLIREEGHAADWPSTHGAHLKRAREDCRDPSSLIVWTFELGLPADHTPAQFVAKVLPIIAACSPVVDHVVSEQAAEF